jgi:hypothetical protein
MAAAIEARGLRKRYGSVEALRGIDLTVETGTVFGLLGPNGAGKTTAVRILTTLLCPDEGTARVIVDGIDVLTDAPRLRSHIGVAGQYAAVDENLTGFENLEMVGMLYHLGRAKSRARAHELLDAFDLADAGATGSRHRPGTRHRRRDAVGAERSGGRRAARDPLVQSGRTGAGSRGARRSRFVPVESMPSWLQPFAESNPFTVMVNAARALFVGTPAGNDVWLAFAWGAVITVVFALLSIWRYRRAVAR